MFRAIFLSLRSLGTRIQSDTDAGTSRDISGPDGPPRVRLPPIDCPGAALEASARQGDNGDNGETKRRSIRDAESERIGISMEEILSIALAVTQLLDTILHLPWRMPNPLQLEFHLLRGQ
jgi:hypothetical protein